MSDNPGTMALDEGGRVDFARMRRERRERVLAAMERHGVDVLVLGREGNARYASGARRLSLAGTRPFGPGCVVVRATGQVHLISTWDDGIPPEIPHENLFGITWNPLNYVEWIKGMEGVAGASRVGVDGMSPLFGQLLPLAVPDAELVAADELMFEARKTKTADEIACIRTAVAVAEASLSTAIAVLRPGVRERDLLGAFERQMADLGVTVPAREGTFCVTPREHAETGGLSLRRIATDLAINEGDLVAMSSGVLYAGYEGSVARTWPCLGSGELSDPQRALGARWLKVREALLETCRAGSTGVELRKAYEGTGEPLPPLPIVRGVGLGFEAPVVGTDLGSDAEARWELAPEMTLVIQGYVWEKGVGGYLGSETVLVTDGEPEVLTRLGHGPIAA